MLKRRGAGDRAVRIRGRRKRSSGAVSTSTTTDQPWSVTLDPRRCKLAPVTNGSAIPETLLAAHMIPIARPLRRTNHSSRYKVVGANNKPLPTALRMP